MSIPSLEEIKEGAVLLIDKDLTWTSFDVINKLRKSIHTKIGHAGTLDPLATGLLICCTGKMTKKITDYQKQDKVYTGIFQLGAVTPTYDLESEPHDFKDFSSITPEIIQKTIQENFLGEISQYPPIHSAVKKDGKPAYLLARAGKEVKLDPRIIQIHSFNFELKEGGEIHFEILCSTGTYIRSIAHDIGQALGVGAYLKSLRRNKIGEFNVDNAHKVEDLYQYYTEAYKKLSSTSSI